MTEFKKEIIEYFENAIAGKSLANMDFTSIFDDIQKKFTQFDLAHLLNHILITKTDANLLNFTIRLVNKKKYFDNFSALTDFILKPINSSDFNNLKVLAIKTIGNYKNKKALNPLLFCLNDKNSNYKIRLAAAEALGAIGDENAFEPLQKIAIDEDEKSTYIKESAVTALGMLGDTRALDVFESIINTKQMFQEKFIYLKENVLEALSKFDISKGKRAYNILKGVIEGEHETELKNYAQEILDEYEEENSDDE